jgi:hypothetical protein
MAMAPLTKVGPGGGIEYGVELADGEELGIDAIHEWMTVQGYRGLARKVLGWDARKRESS